MRGPHDAERGVSSMAPAWHENRNLIASTHIGSTTSNSSASTSMNAFKLFGLGTLLVAATASMASAQAPYGFQGSSCGTGYSNAPYRTQPYVHSGSYGNGYGGFGSAYVGSGTTGYPFRQSYATPYAGSTGYRSGMTYDAAHGDYHSTPGASQRPFHGHSGHTMNQWPRW